MEHLKAQCFRNVRRQKQKLHNLFYSLIQLPVLLVNHRVRCSHLERKGIEVEGDDQHQIKENLSMHDNNDDPKRLHHKTPSQLPPLGNPLSNLSLEQVELALEILHDKGLPLVTQLPPILRQLPLQQWVVLQIALIDLMDERDNAVLH